MFARRPLQLGPEEIVFPPKGIDLPEGKLVTVSDDAGEAILAKHAHHGVMKVPDNTTPDEVPELLLQVQRTRYNFLRKQLDAYRLEQGNRQASGIPIMMPNDNLRQKFNEAKKLRQHLMENDPILKETMAALPGEKALISEPDTLAEELREFGLHPKAAPLQPGITAWDQELPAEMPV